MKTCPKCNYLIENDSAKFCRNCGANVENVSSALSEEEIVTIAEAEVDQSSENVQTTSVSPVTEETVESPDTTTKNKYTPTHTYTPEISGFFTFVLWMIVLGGILTPIIGLITFDRDAYSGASFLILSDISTCILAPILAIYSVVSTYKKRAGSVTLIRIYLWIVLISKLFVIFANQFSGISPFDIGNIVWNIIFISYMYFSETVSDVFPKAIRKTNILDKCMIWSFILIPSLFFILGIFQLALSL